MNRAMVRAATRRASALCAGPLAKKTVFQPITAGPLPVVDPRVNRNSDAGQHNFDEYPL